MSFIIGCNYWASNAGIEMWQQFDKDAIKEDLRVLSENGVKEIRVFPLWRDFQPVTPLIGPQGRISEYYVNGEPGKNKYYLDEDMLSRFEVFLDLCDEAKIRVMVGLITGWMSGALFLPTALYGKNLITDPMAQYFEQMFIKGFVSHFKDRETIFAWDLGNECNGMAPINGRFEAASWAAMISNAIRAVDNTRPIVSGMHGLEIDKKWTIRDQGEFCDLLTTHPYPFWCEHTRIDETLSYRTTLLPTAQGKYYSDIGKKPCLAEEFGTMGPMVCSDELSADFTRLNLYSLWAHGQKGLMHWCSSDQTELTTFPYTHQMVERELGAMNNDRTPKPQLLEIKKFSEFLEKIDFTLPEYKDDAVCILTYDQRHWGVAYMTYILARRAGLNLKYTYSEDTLPDSDLYLLPSVNQFNIMSKRKYDELLCRIWDGATLYVSVNDAILSQFESYTGLKVIDSSAFPTSVCCDFCDEKIETQRTRSIRLATNGATVLATEENGNPFITVNTYGKGKVYFVNAPIEDSLIDTPSFTDMPIANLYRLLFKEKSQSLPVSISDPELLTTFSEGDDFAIVTVMNHTREMRRFDIKVNGYTLEKIYHGEKNKVNPYDACVYKFTKK